jgi:hypothetical protein
MKLDCNVPPTFYLERFPTLVFALYANRQTDVLKTISLKPFRGACGCLRVVQVYTFLHIYFNVCVCVCARQYAFLLSSLFTSPRCQAGSPDTPQGPPARSTRACHRPSKSLCVWPHFRQLMPLCVGAFLKAQTSSTRQPPSPATHARLSHSHKRRCPAFTGGRCSA